MMPAVGVCLEFGPHIADGCGVAMVAADEKCVCPACGVVCQGRFQGCRSVWERGPQAVTLGRKNPVETAARGSRFAPTDGGGPQVLQPAHVDGDGARPADNDVAAVAPSQEHLAVADMARTLEDAVGRLEAGQELHLRPILVRIEARLDELLAGLHDDGTHPESSTNGKGPGSVADGLDRYP